MVPDQILWFPTNSTNIRRVEEEFDL